MLSKLLAAIRNRASWLASITILNLPHIAVAGILSLFITTCLYWPLHQPIELKNENADVTDEVLRLDLPLDEEVQALLERKIDLPRDKHELCLENRNSFYLLHSDSNTPGIPFEFTTADLNETAYGKDNKLAAMSIKLFYNEGLPLDENYREFSEPLLCVGLTKDKLNKYASSSIEYRYVNLGQSTELMLPDGTKLTLLRSVVSGYRIGTDLTRAYIGARPISFLGTLASVFIAVMFVTTIISPPRRHRSTAHDEDQLEKES